MNTKQLSVEQKTKFEESLGVLDEVIAILQRIEKREQTIGNTDGKSSFE